VLHKRANGLRASLEIDLSFSESEAEADVREGGVLEDIQDSCPEEIVSVKTLSAEQLITAP
jgi:hypothetical protein